MVPFMQGSIKVACQHKQRYKLLILAESIIKYSNHVQTLGTNFTIMLLSYGTITGDAVWKTPSTPCMDW